MNDEFSTHIIPECFIDTNLVETLVPTKKGYNHQTGCFKVVELIQNRKQLKEGFALGIIDEDKRIVKYASEFELIVEATQLKLLKHPKKNHYLIYIVPAVEKWILKNAEEVGLNLEDWGLPNDFLKLQDYTKIKTSRYDVKFKQIFKQLQKKEASGIICLSEWIAYLKEHPFDADMTLPIILRN
jgi:hypothetical protein